MADMTFVVPGSIDARTGGSIYDRRMVDGLRRRGWRVDVRELDDSFPFPPPAALRRAAKSFADLPSGRLVLVDGLAFGAMPDVLEREAGRLRLVPIVHLPLAATIGFDAQSAKRLEVLERRAWTTAGFVVITGLATRELMGAHGLSHDRVVVVEPGTDPAPVARGSGSSLVHLVTVAALTPGKGHELLIEALGAVPARGWRLTCAGSLTRHHPTVQQVRAAIARLGLADRVALCGELDAGAVAACYERADVVVVPSLRETFGMTAAEALARGLPVIGTTTGAIPSLVGDEAGLLVRPGDREALSRALWRMIEDAGLRRCLSDGARRVRDRLRDWDAAASELSSHLEGIAGGG
jgi:glycosyltransferase involved in cell wall biosynthesis